MTNLSAIPNVRHARNDFEPARRQNFRMAKRPRKPRLEQYESFKEASGWYLAAWRDFRGLTLEDLAAEANTSKGMVSDLETGALRSTGGTAQRFNRDWIDKFSTALNVTGGHLLDVNPFTTPTGVTEIADRYGKLSDDDRQAVDQLVDHLLSRLRPTG